MAWHQRVEQVEELHLNLLLKMVALSNFNAKMNSLKEVGIFIIYRDERIRLWIV